MLGNRQSRIMVPEKKKTHGMKRALQAPWLCIWRRFQNFSTEQRTAVLLSRRRESSWPISRYEATGDQSQRAPETGIRVILTSLYPNTRLLTCGATVYKTWLWAGERILEVTQHTDNATLNTGKSHWSYPGKVTLVGSKATGLLSFFTSWEKSR